MTSDDLSGALHTGLLATSLAPHAARVHLGPSYYTMLAAQVTVKNGGAAALDALDARDVRLVHLVRLARRLRRLRRGGVALGVEHRAQRRVLLAEHALQHHRSDGCHVCDTAAMGVRQILFTFPGRAAALTSTMSMQDLWRARAAPAGCLSLWRA